MKTFYHLPAIFLSNVLLMLCQACACEEPALQREPQFVVEGWIEDGAKPVVIVTRVADLSTATGPIDNLVQRWCRVTVSDGEESEILAMHINKDYTPPVIYTSARLKGKVGHTYTLTIETELNTMTAVTTIPPVVRIDSVVAKPKPDDESMFGLKLFAQISPEKSKYYKIFTQVNSETRYYSSFLGLFTADEYDCSQGWTASRGIHQTHEGHFTPAYTHGDTVNIKLCTLDAAAFSFWQQYETAVSLQSNFFFSSTNEVSGNIIGGKGYWAGYGTSFARIIIK